MPAIEPPGRFFIRMAEDHVGVVALRSPAEMVRDAILAASFHHVLPVSARPAVATTASAPAQVPPEAALSPARYVQRRPACWRYGRVRGRLLRAIGRHLGGRDQVRWHGRHAAGKWTLGIAEKIGVAVAAEAIKRAM